MSVLKKTAVIDIDNTLWPFSDAFYRELKKINGRFPTPDQWFNFDIWEGYCSEEDFFRATDRIHHHQDSGSHQPYPEAREFLSGLRNNHFQIILASHRVPSTKSSTERWLAQHSLIYDDLHLSLDKTVLFPDAHVVVDDAPPALEKAAQSGLLATGLLCPWNQACAGNGFGLFRNLDEVLDYILRNI